MSSCSRCLLQALLQVLTWISVKIAKLRVGTGSVHIADAQAAGKLMCGILGSRFTWGDSTQVRRFLRSNPAHALVLFFLNHLASQQPLHPSTAVEARPLLYLVPTQGDQSANNNG